MNIAHYCKAQRDFARENSGHIKDFSVFDFNYIPPEPFMREESKHLINEMLKFELSGIPSNQAVIGSKGSGKTLILKYLQRLMGQQTDLKVLYANCREHNTSFKIFAHFLEVQARGASLSELYTKFCNVFTGKTVVVLDEVDLMSPKDRRKDILYFLSRSENPYMVIMLSNNFRLLKDLDAPTRSSLQPMNVYFKNYDAEQMNLILQNRAQQGLANWDKASLSRIAALTTKKTNGDARVAIKTLYYSVTEGHADIEACFDKARKNIIVDMINDLSDPTLMILQAVGTSRSGYAKDIYKKYTAISLSHNDRPFSYVHFYSNLSYLQSMGLVALLATKINRAYTNRVMLTFDEPILEPIFKMRFGQV